MSKASYYQEAFECAMDAAGCYHLIEQMTPEQRAEVGDGIAGSVECEGMAFYRPENPMLGENDRLRRKLKWERELDQCGVCHGTGREKYSAGPWAVDATCYKCHGQGKNHPRGEREPA